MMFRRSVRPKAGEVWGTSTSFLRKRQFGLRCLDQYNLRSESVAADHDGLWVLN
jgi:hypothetical protein